MNKTGIEDPDIFNKKSSASNYVSNIKHIIFGGVNSRFWMLRKHFNSMQLKELDIVPFYSWNCISLEMNHRVVDLVIKDEGQMSSLLKFLIYKLRTIDGVKNSANLLLEQINLESMSRYKEINKTSVVPN